MGLRFLYNGITFAILRISGKIPWLRDRLHMYDRCPSIYGIINLRGPKRISSYPGAESFSKFKMFLISWLETGVRNNECICLSLRYLSGEPLCPSKDLDKVGPILTKTWVKLFTNYSFVTCDFTTGQLEFSLYLGYFVFSYYFFNNWPCFPHVSFIHF